MNNIIEEMHFLNIAPSGIIAANEDIFDGDPATDIVSMENWRDIIFIILKNAGATGTATITVESCDTIVPGTATAIAFRYKKMTTIDTWSAWTEATSSGVATTAGADQMYMVHVRAEELSGTDKFVRMQLTEVVNSPCDGAVGAVLLNPRYAEDVNATVLT